MKRSLSKFIENKNIGIIERNNTLFITLEPVSYTHLLCIDRETQAPLLKYKRGFHLLNFPLNGIVIYPPKAG